MDIARLNFSHGDRADHEEGVPSGPQRGRQLRAWRSASSPTCRGRRSGSAGSPHGPVDWQNGGDHPDHRRRRGRHPRPGVHDLQGPGRRRPPGRPAAGRRRPGRADRPRGRRHGRGLPVDEGGTVSDNKGISLPGMNVSVPALSEKDIADLEFALGLERRLHRAVVRPLPARTSSWSTRSWTRSGVRLPVIAKLEKPEAVDNLEAIVDGLRRDHGRPRRPGRRAAPGEGAGGAEARRAAEPARTPSR